MIVTLQQDNMEIFKDIPNYEGLYQVSNFGNVKSIRNNKILSPAKHKCGYIWVILCNNKVRKTFFVHRLVALTFIPNEKNKPQVNHKDSNKLNNILENLEWADNRENHTHSLIKKETSSIYTGVYFSNQKKKWLSKIYINGKSKHLGTHNCETKAYISYMNFLKQNNVTNKYA